MIKALREARTAIQDLPKDDQLNLIKISFTMFGLLFGYPLIRATITAIFLQGSGAKSSPIVWLATVVCLVAGIFLFNRFQEKLKIHRLFLYTSAITIFLLFLFLFAQRFSPLWAYPLFIVKEVYIVLLIHSTLGYLNSSIQRETAKIIYGPLGAIGSIGGILGGISVSIFSKGIGVESTLIFGIMTLIPVTWLFLSTAKKYALKKSSSYNYENSQEKTRPLESLGERKKYVLMICALVMLSQFVISLYNFKFNLALESFYPQKEGKSEFLGVIYTWMNVTSLFIQVIAIPILFRAFKQRTVHFFIPIMLVSFYFLSNLSLGLGILPIAITFIVFKGTDYSLFAAAKELLYFVLTPRQRYGAKYIVDMVTYRFSKGLISFILIFIQNPHFVNILIYFSICLWLICLYFLFKKHNEYSITEVLHESTLA